MAEGSAKGGKASKKKAKAADEGVMASLPSTRPNRLGRRRDGAAGAGGDATPAKPKPKPRATPKPKAAAKPKAAPKPKPAAAPANVATEQPAHKTFTRTEADPVTEATRPAAKKDTGRKPKTARGTTNPAPRDRSGEGGPPPVRPGAPALKPETEAEDRGPAPDETPSGTELVTTVVKAAGELAQIGLTVGGQVLKRAVDRLPKP